MYIEGKLCRKCQHELGKANYVLIQDKISRHIHTFHVACAPKDPDLRRHHGMHAEPGVFNTKGSPLGARVTVPKITTNYDRLIGELKNNGSL